MIQIQFIDIRMLCCFFIGACLLKKMLSLRQNLYFKDRATKPNLCLLG